MKKKFLVIILLFFITMPVFAQNPIKVKTSLNPNSKREIGDLILIDHTINNDKAYLEPVKYINIYHSYDKNTLEFIGIMAAQAVEYCNFRASDFMTCSIVQENRFQANQVFATTVYKVKKALADKNIKYSYSTNVVKEKSIATTAYLTSNTEENETGSSVDSTKSTINSTIDARVGDVTTLDISPEFSEFSRKDLNFKSSNPQIGSVDAEGKLFAKKAGRVTITVTKGEIVQTINVNIKESASAKKSVWPLVIGITILALAIIIIIYIARRLFLVKKVRDDEIYIGD